jgi:hypothetical protein
MWTRLTRGVSRATGASTSKFVSFAHFAGSITGFRFNVTAGFGLAPTPVSFTE